VAPAANCGLVIPGVVPPGPTSPIRSAPAGVGRCFPFRSKRPASGEFEDKGWLEAHRCPSNRTAATDGIRTAEASAPVAACCAPWKWPTLTRLSPRAPRSFAQSFGIRLSSVRGFTGGGRTTGVRLARLCLLFAATASLCGPWLGCGDSDADTGSRGDQSGKGRGPGSKTITTPSGGIVVTPAAPTESVVAPQTDCQREMGDARQGGKVVRKVFIVPPAPGLEAQRDGPRTVRAIITFKPARTL